MLGIVLGTLHELTYLMCAGGVIILIVGVGKLGAESLRDLAGGEVAGDSLSQPRFAASASTTQCAWDVTGLTVKLEHSSDNSSFSVLLCSHA